MVRVYGYSDDLVEIEGSLFSEHEIDCYNSDVHILFKDGTLIRVHYGKPKIGGVWQIVVEEQGTANQNLTVCEDENADIYSDVFEIEAEIVRTLVIRDN